MHCARAKPPHAELALHLSDQLAAMKIIEINSANVCSLSLEYLVRRWVVHQ